MGLNVCRWDDPTSWNDFVASVPNAHFQQSWEWGELAPELGGRPVRLAAVEHGEIAAGMQLFVNNLSRTGRTHLYVPRGPAVVVPSVRVLGPLFDAARKEGERQNAVGIRAEPNVCTGDGKWQKNLAALGLREGYPPSQPRSSWVLDVASDEDTLMRNMKQKTRYNIRLSAKKGVEVSEGGPGDLDEFYAVFRETADRDDFFIHGKEVYRRMFHLMWSVDRFAMLVARHQGQLVAAITLVRFGATCWYLHGASSNRHRNLMATYLLQWHGIKWAKRHGCTLYDFRAVPDRLAEDQDMYGVYRFKEGFGGRQFTALHSYNGAYQPGLFGLWQLYFSGRFKLDGWSRRRKGLPARQFA